MIKALLFLTALGLVHGAQKSLTVSHPDCPSSGHALLPHEYDCKKFYYCEGGLKFVNPRDCAPGTEFSATQQVCIQPSLANCRLSGSGAATNAPIAAPTAAPQARPSSAPNDGVTDCEVLDNGCPVDFDIHKLLPHETSCKKFYYCVRGEKVLSSCPSGNAFNPAIERCDHAANVDRTCEDDASSEEDTIEDEDIEIEFLPNGCPANWNITWALPHVNCCNRFYQCNFGGYFERRCPPGTHFNFKIQQCDQIYNAACTLPGGDCVWEDATTEVAVPTTKRPSIDFQDNGCPVDHSINWMVAHEDDCTKFYICVWGDKLLSVCPAGLHFNVESQVCDNPATAGCQHWDCNTCNNCDKDDCSQENPDTPNDTVEDSPECNGNDCNNDNNGCTGADCDTEDSGEDNNECTGDDCNNECTGNDCNNECNGDDCNNGCTGDDCNNECTGDDCNNGCTGNDCSNECTGDDCNNGCTGDDCNNECTGDGCGNNISSEEDLPVGDDDGEPDCEDPPAEVENNKCAEECNVLPWAHDDCDKYWACDGDKPLLVTCTEGLHFNPNTHTCDFACNAGCVRQNVQATASHDGLKVFFPWDKIDDNTRSLLKLIAH